MSNYAFNSLTPRFYDKVINAKIKAKFGLESHPWQVSIVANITHYKRDVFVISNTNTEKSLTYQSTPKVTGRIVLVISPIIALMKDQI